MPQHRRRLYSTPGELALALDPNITVQTPALDLIDSELVQVEQAVDVMLRRRELFAKYVASGMSNDEALQCVQYEVEGAGNDRLIVSLSPQEGKSQRISRRFPTWLLLNHPDLRIAIASYEYTTARRWGKAVRDDIITHDLLPLDQSSTAANEWSLDGHLGGVYSVGIGGALTGRPVDCLIIDDPIKDRPQADSIVYRENVWNWWTDVALARLAPGAVVVLVLTRWHEDDLAGRLLSSEDGNQWRFINIPAIADHNPELGQVDPLGREPGEWLVSARGRTVEQWEARRRATPPRTWTSLYQGRPSPDAGDVFNRNWWMRFETPIWTQEPGSDRFVIPEATEVLQSWDLAFKDSKGSDFVVGQVWARKGAFVYLVDEVRGRWSFTDTVESFRRLTAKWPQAVLKLVEDKANGPAVISALRKEIGGIVAVQVKDSKPARASAVSPFIESNNVFLPATSIAMYDVEAFIEECTQFPNAAHDDQVDAMTQALARIYIKGSAAKDWLESLAPPCPECGQPNDKTALVCVKCHAELRNTLEEQRAQSEQPDEPFSLSSGVNDPKKQQVDHPDPFTQAVQDMLRQVGTPGGSSVLPRPFVR